MDGCSIVWKHASSHAGRSKPNTKDALLRTVRKVGIVPKLKAVLARTGSRVGSVLTIVWLFWERVEAQHQKHFVAHCIESWSSVRIEGCFGFQNWELCWLQNGDWLIFWMACSSPGWEVETQHQTHVVAPHTHCKLVYRIEKCLYSRIGSCVRSESTVVLIPRVKQVQVVLFFRTVSFFYSVTESYFDSRIESCFHSRGIFLFWFHIRSLFWFQEPALRARFFPAPIFARFPRIWKGEAKIVTFLAD